MRNLLVENGQKPTISVSDRSIFFLAQHGDKVIGMIGAELSETSALIRSTAVLQAWRNNGVAHRLVITLFNYLRAKNITRLYLFSRESGGYWKKRGFEQCPVQEIIDNLSDALQVIAYLQDKSISTDVA